MATRKSKDVWPKVIVGSHSTRTEYEDGRVEFVTDWEKLKHDVSQALREYEQKKIADEAPVEKPKTKRKLKEKK